MAEWAATSPSEGGEARVETPAPDQSARRMPVCLLVGNPNSGKTTLFNALTGLRHKVANYPGVTVEARDGVTHTQHGHPIRLIDLPGAYSLAARSPDERLLQGAVLGRSRLIPEADILVCVLDASNLERNLYLASQCLDAGKPMILVLNMMDVARRRGIEIDTVALGKRLGVPVIATEAVRKKGIIDLRLALTRPPEPPQPRELHVNNLIRAALGEVEHELGQSPLGGRQSGSHRAEAWSILMEDDAEESEARLLLQVDPDSGSRQHARAWRERLDREIPGWRSQVVAERYRDLGDICGQCVKRLNPGRRTWTDRLDSVLLQPVTGGAVLVAVLFALFYSIFKLAVPVMDGIDASVGAVGNWIAAVMPEGMLRDLLADGVVAGVGAVVVFLPQIMLLFFFIALLESSGYLARASFLLDRMMRKAGLPGQAFIPLLSAHACAIPAIMAARTIPSARDRMVTILVAPLMGCSARLPVYLLLIALLIPPELAPPAYKALMLTALYALGIVGGMAVAWVLKKTAFKSRQMQTAVELPAYQMPSVRFIISEMLLRAWVFVRRAGTIILSLSIVLWFLLSFPADENLEGSAALEHSIAGRMGKAIEPVLEPLGYDWRIGVGIVASTAAREVFVSTMAIIVAGSEDPAEDRQQLSDILHGTTRPDGTPLFTPLVSLSLMVFFVFALQCLSTVAIVKRETQTWKWPILQWVYLTSLAYGAAFVVYQGGRLLGFT